MEDIKLIEFGIVGVMLFMIFQYIIKPIISAVVEKKKNNKHLTAQEIENDLRYLKSEKRDIKICDLKHSHINDILERINKSQNELTHGQKLIADSLSEINREVGEIKATIQTRESLK